MVRKNNLTVSIRDVAARAGVSFTTVSKVLNDRPGDRTAAETRRRIRQAAEELDYQPNAVAQSLRSRRTDSIGFYTGLICPDMTDPFQAAVFNGLHQGCQAHNKDLLIHRKFYGHPPEDVYKDLLNRKVDGIVLPAWCDDVIVQRLVAAAFPAVGIAAPDAGLPSVYVDSPNGFRQVAAYLAAQGHKRVLYRTQRLDLLTDIDDIRRRRHAFEQAAAQHGMAVVVSDSNEAGDITEREEAILFGPRPQRPTAAACWNDRYAYQTVAFCWRHGMQVPGDLAVTGFDDFPVPFSLPYRLTTVSAPWAECASAAVGLVAAMMKGESIPAKRCFQWLSLPAARPDLILFFDRILSTPLLLKEKP